MTTGLRSQLPGAVPPTNALFALMALPLWLPELLVSVLLSLVYAVTALPLRLPELLAVLLLLPAAAPPPESFFFRLEGLGGLWSSLELPSESELLVPGLRSQLPGAVRPTNALYALTALPLWTRATQKATRPMAHPSLSASMRAVTAAIRKATKATSILTFDMIWKTTTATSSVHLAVLC